MNARSKHVLSLLACVVLLSVRLKGQTTRSPIEPVSCIEVRGGVMSPNGSGQLLAQTTALCQVAHDWLVWHIWGIGALLDGTAKPFSGAPEGGPDLLLLAAQSGIGQSWRIVLDSISARRTGSRYRDLWFRLDTGALASSQTPLLSWRVRHRLQGDTSRFRFDDSCFPDEGRESSHEWTIRIADHAKPTLRLKSFEAQIDSIERLRRRFGSDGALPQLTVLVAPPADTTLASTGVVWSVAPQFASLWYRRRLLVSPVRRDGGIDFHELAHLVHPNDRPINPLFAEAFAVAIGGSMGHGIEDEVCLLSREQQMQQRIAKLMPSQLLHGYDHLSKLLLAVALSDVFRSEADLTGFFAPRFWRPPANPWQDLSAITAHSTESLLQRSIVELQKIAKRCH